MRTLSQNHPLVLLALALLLGAADGVGQAVKLQKPEVPTREQPVFAVIETSMGSMKIELYQADAPKTVENFEKLAEKKFFDGTRVHRVSRTEGIVQMGDDKSKDTTKVSEWGTGGHSAWGKEFQDELYPNSASYKEGYRKGVVAMMNRGPNTNGSQFFIALKDLPYMPRNYTIFGKVVQGQDILDRIGKVQVVPLLGADDGRPKQSILVKRITIMKETNAKSEDKK